MKTLITILALLFWVTCSKAQTPSIGGIEIPEFPNQSYLDSLKSWKLLSRNGEMKKLKKQRKIPVSS